MMIKLILITIFLFVCKVSPNDDYTNDYDLLNSLIDDISYNNTHLRILPTQQYNATDPIENNNFTSALAVYYAGFIGPSYCYSEEIDLGLCCNEELDYRHWERYNKSIFTSKENEAQLIRIIKDKYNHQILYSHLHKKVLILFPGTRSYDQLTVELSQYSSSSFKSYSSLNVFHYFNQLYSLLHRSFYLHLTQFYKDYPETREYQTIFEGHSLGGAMATIFAMDSVAEGIVKKTINSPVLISFGQPRVGNSKFVRQVESVVPVIFRIVKNGDNVPKVPFNTYECTQNNLRCNDVNYRFVHTKGLKMIDDKMTVITECEERDEEREVYYNDSCSNRLTVLDGVKSHVYYFWPQQRITEGCPSNGNEV